MGPRWALMAVFMAVVALEVVDFTVGGGFHGGRVRGGDGGYGYGYPFGYGGYCDDEEGAYYLVRQRVRSRHGYPRFQSLPFRRFPEFALKLSSFEMSPYARGASPSG